MTDNTDTKFPWFWLILSILGIVNLLLMLPW